MLDSPTWHPVLASGAGLWIGPTSNSKSEAHHPTTNSNKRNGLIDPTQNTTSNQDDRTNTKIAQDNCFINSQKP
jgi:hypothetical protein